MKTKFSYYASVAWIALLAVVGIAILAIAPKGKLQSESENRYLQELPTPSLETIANGEFTGDFEKFLADKFFARDSIISFAADLKALFSVLDYSDLLEFGAGAEDSFVDETLTAQQPQDTTAPGSADSTDTASDTPAPEDTGEALTPDGSSYPYELTIWGEAADGSRSTFLRCLRPDVATTAEIVNRFARTLPEGGRVYYLNVLQAWYANQYISSRGQNSGWYTDIPGYMQTQVEDNVQVLSITEVMQQPIEAGEYVYFRTDTHWTPLGAHYAYSALISQQGIEPIPYEAYQFEAIDGFLGVYYNQYRTEAMRKQADRLDLVTPLVPVEYYRCTGREAWEQYPLIDRSKGVAHGVYLGGNGSGLSSLRSQAGTGRRALVVMDSFGLIPSIYLSAHYDELYLIDPRFYSEKTVGCSASEFIKQKNIEDIYFIVSDINGHGKDFTTIYTDMIIRG